MENVNIPHYLKKIINFKSKKYLETLRLETK